MLISLHACTSEALTNKCNPPPQVAQLSDRDVWVYAVVTPAALHAFECDAGFGRPFSSLRGGLVNLTRSEMLVFVTLNVHAHNRIPRMHCTRTHRIHNKVAKFYAIQTS